MPINRVAKLRLMHLYPNKKLQKINHMHASLDKNLPELVRNQISAFAKKLKSNGYLFRRVPSINLQPVDVERAQLEGVKKAAILKQAADFFNNAGSRHLNSQYKTELGDGKSKPRLRESASPFTRREPFNSSNGKRTRITSAIHELRSNACDFGCAKDLVISKENINKSLNFVRKNIHFMTKVKTKTGLV